MRQKATSGFEPLNKRPALIRCTKGVRIAVLALMADGHSAKTAAARMNYSIHTVKDFLKTINRKTGARNVTHAVALAYRAGDLDATT